jgi:hypothetical protein
LPIRLPPSMPRGGKWSRTPATLGRDDQFPHELDSWRWPASRKHCWPPPTRRSGRARITITAGPAALASRRIVARAHPKNGRCSVAMLRCTVDVAMGQRPPTGAPPARHSPEIDRRGARPWLRPSAFAGVGSASTRRPALQVPRCPRWRVTPIVRVRGRGAADVRSKSLPFNNRERASAFRSAGARLLVGLQGDIVTVTL